MKANSQEIQAVSASKTNESIKWVVVVLLLSGAVIGNFYIDSLGVVMRVLLLVLFLAAALGVAAITEKGRQGIDFAKASRMEMRKVVWPTRQETVQTGMIVIAALAIVSLILWGIDGIFVRMISFISGV